MTTEHLRFPHWGGWDILAECYPATDATQTQPAEDAEVVFLKAENGRQTFRCVDKFLRYVRMDAVEFDEALVEALAAKHEGAA